MDNKHKEEQANAEKNAAIIMTRIKEESVREAAQVLERARQEAAKIIDDASMEAERKRAQILGGLRLELEKLKERIFSGVNLEKKRIILEEKNRFIQQVLGEVRALAELFRKQPGYEDFLRRAVAEGAKVVGADTLEVVYAITDDTLFLSGSFIKSLESLCQGVLKRTVAFKYIKGEFDEPGVIVSTPGGGIQFDNRFSRRLERLQGEIYEQLLKSF